MGPPTRPLSAPRQGAPIHAFAAAGLGLAVAGTALAFSTRFISVYGFAKALTLGSAVLLASLGAVLSKDRRPARTALDVPLAVLAAVLALSAFRSEDLTFSLLGPVNLLAHGLWSIGLLMALAWLTAWLAKDRESALLKACLAAYGLAGLYALLQTAGLEPFAGLPPITNHRATASFGSPVSLGEGMALLLPLGLYWMSETRERLLGWACFLALLAGLAASISRGAWLGAAAGCGVYLLVRHGRPGRARLWLAAAAAAVVLAAFGWQLQRRPLRALDGGRTLIWRLAWDVSRERPILGTGPNTFLTASRRHKTAELVHASTLLETQAHAHNDLLQALATTGAAGLAAYLLLCAVVAAAAVRACRDPGRPWALAVSCGLLGLFVNAKFNPVPVEVLACAAFFAGLLCAARPADDRGARWPLYLLLAAAVASEGLALRLAWAETEAKTGRRLAARPAGFEPARLRLERAVRLNPWEPGYRIALVNLLAARSLDAPSPSARRELLDAADRHGREIAARHPNDPQSNYIAGLAALNLAWAKAPGKLEEAERALDKAASLDPTFLPILQSRRDAASLRGDVGKVAELEARLKTLSADELRTVLRRRVP